MPCEKYLRKSLLVGIYMLGVLGILASGGGDDDDDDDEIIIKSSYDFTIGGPLEGAAGNSIIGIEREGGFTLTVEPDLQGQLICNQDTEICELQFVYMGSSIAIDDQTIPEFVGDIEVTVEDDWLYSPLGTDQPVGGRFRVVEAGEPPIVVEFTNCQGSSDTEVQVTFDPGSLNQEVNCYQWDLFEDLFDSSDPNVEWYERQASFGWEAAAFIVLEQVLNALEVFPLIDEDIFAGGNQIFENCEIYSGTWPPPTPANPGGFLFSWFDDAANGQVGPGDSFRQTFQECWFGDSTDGTLIEGVIDYVGYTEVINQLGLLTRIGFESAAPGSGKIGGVAFGDENGNNPLVITETTEDGGNITTEPPITLTGRYLIVFE